MKEEIRKRYDRLRQVFSLIDIDDDTDYREAYQYSDENKKEWLLADGVDVTRSVDVWCKQFGRVQHNACFFVFGIGSVEYLFRMHECYPDNIAVFFEPCEENILRIAMDERLDQILEFDNFIIISGENQFRHLERIQYTVLRYENMMEAQYAVMPNYAKIWETVYRQFITICKYANNKRIMDRNTQIIFQDSMAKNYLYHLQRCIAESELGLLEDTIQSGEISNYPALIISAGPSLDKNIDRLHEYEGRMFVVCVDAALNTAQKHGIIPDIIISVDSVIKGMKALESKEYAHIPMVITMSNSIPMVKEHSGRLFYEIDDDSYTRKITGLQDGRIEMMESGGSVANNAFSLVRLLGFKNIILIGQDLAYPDNRLHADGAFTNEKQLDSTDDKYFYVDDIYGGQVLSEANMCMYREWFEKRIENYKALEVIDATEGGALIKGTKIMTLKDALEEYCPKQEMDFKSRIDSAEYLCNEEKRNKAEEELQKLPQKIDAIIERMQSEKKIYGKLDQLNRKGKYRSKEFKNCVKNIEQFTHYMDTVPEVQLLVRLVYKDSYEMRETIEKDEENIYADIKKIVDSGLKMIDAYTEAGEKIKEYWEQMREGTEV